MAEAGNSIEALGVALHKARLARQGSRPPPGPGRAEPGAPRAATSPPLPRAPSWDPPPAKDRHQARDPTTHVPDKRQGGQSPSAVALSTGGTLSHGARGASHFTDGNGGRRERERKMLVLSVWTNPQNSAHKTPADGAPLQPSR